MNDAAATPVNATQRTWWFTPVLGPLLTHRPLAVMLAVAGVIQVMAGVVGFRTLPCPMLHAVGIPCPGCGASRASGALLRGDWESCAHLHALAPLFMGAVAMFLTAAVLPQNARAAMISRVDALERSTGLAKLLLVLVFVYWIARLLYSQDAFIRLMRG